MVSLPLLSASDTQLQMAQALRQRRKAQKLSRDALAERSTVPAPTIKKFETTGQISLRQFVLLWQCLDDLSRLAALAQPLQKLPTSIDEVLRS
jgi:transcriptional regulator with XRE-family HTH domain